MDFVRAASEEQVVWKEGVNSGGAEVIRSAGAGSGFASTSSSSSSSAAPARPLFEQLEAQRLRAEEEAARSARPLHAPPRGLDEEELAFLDEQDELRRARDEEERRQEALDREAFETAAALGAGAVAAAAADAAAAAVLGAVRDEDERRRRKERAGAGWPAGAAGGAAGALGAAAPRGLGTLGVGVVVRRKQAGSGADAAVPAAGASQTAAGVKRARPAEEDERAPSAATHCASSAASSPELAAPSPPAAAPAVARVDPGHSAQLLKLPPPPFAKRGVGASAPATAPALRGSLVDYDDDDNGE
jgi:hypothetical protein